jgi:alpha-galactosidase
MAGVDVLTIAKFFVSSGLRESGYEYVNSDEGWEQKQRDKKTGRIVPGPGFGGSDAGMKALVAQVHGMGLKLGLYGAASGVTCGTMPGQLYHEDLDAQTYADCESRR